MHSAGERHGGLKARVFIFVVTAVALWLGAQVAIEFLKLRAPVSLAVRLPGPKAEVLGRLAEAQFAQGDLSTAAEAATACIQRAPFSTRCVRVAGLVADKQGDTDLADRYLTIAGNWSLRDDQAHAWLVDRRLRQGNYYSAFSHADALLRRRGEYQEIIFPLFTRAATLDPRGFSSVARKLSELPPWHFGYFVTLSADVETLGLGSGLLLTLLNNRLAVPDATSEIVVINLGRANQADVLKRIKASLGPGISGERVVDGDFDLAREVRPLTWELANSANWAVASEPGVGLDDGPGLHLGLNGFPSGTIAKQLTFLPAAPYRLVVNVKGSGDLSAPPVANWVLTCWPQPTPIMTLPLDAVPQDRFGELSATFEVPSGCPAQSLELIATPRERRVSADFVFDRLTIEPATSR